MLAAAGGVALEKVFFFLSYLLSRLFATLLNLVSLKQDDIDPSSFVHRVLSQHFTMLSPVTNNDNVRSSLLPAGVGDLLPDTGIQARIPVGWCQELEQ